jgi:hypothetical protein
MVTRKEQQHVYPSDYAPGPNQHWAVNEAWEILDSLRPGAMSDEARAFIAGKITGALMVAARDGGKAKQKGPPVSK